MKMPVAIFRKRSVVAFTRLSQCIVLTIVVGVILAATATEVLACPMCKAALGSQSRNHGDWVGGFFWSILFMLSMPFILFGSLSVYMYTLVRRARREAAGDTGNPRAADLTAEQLVDGPFQLGEARAHEPTVVHPA
jgi:uncharacterized membrane protein